ncbi:ABC transporter permease subunit, partial [Pseudorhodoplanes sp.]|uniref:ABC transporter permease subunit n=1 Tax=Pseudorhodoplanes sp. TaxID=1934341 RepID=UPI003D09F1BF
MTITRIWLGAGVAAIAALFVPHILSPGLDDWAIRFATLLLIAVSWNLMANAGLVSLGHSGFWGLGAYAAGLFANTT